MSIKFSISVKGTKFKFGQSTQSPLSLKLSHSHFCVWQSHTQKVNGIIDLMPYFRGSRDSGLGEPRDPS